MINNTPQKSLRVGLKIGFILVLLLFIGVTLVGLSRMADINRQMQQIVEYNAQKRELAWSANAALLERLVGMHSLVAIADPFDREEESHRVRELGMRFLEARQRLEQLAKMPEEKAVLAQIRDQSIMSRPIAEQVLEDALAGNAAQASMTIRTKAIPAQAAVVRYVNDFIDIQQRETEKVVAEAANSYAEARSLMLGLGAAAAVLGLVIGVVVIRNVTRQADRLQHQAMYDGLTNLPNRALFADRLQQAILIGRREKQPFALIAMDLDRFKEINDTLGHSAGDQMLQHVAVRTRACLRESDTVARMGGDEFSILLATADDVDGAVTVARKILKALAEPIDIAGQKTEIGASLGIAIFPEHGEDGTVLQRAADVAMYLVKQTRGGYKTYSRDIGEGAEHRLTLQGELRHAIANNELVLHFQPQINFESQTIHGVEALVRWHHPKHGLLPPDQFIPQAEQTGLIKPLTYYVLRSALRQCEQWQRMGIDLSVSVNISAVNIQDPEFVEEVAKLLNEFNVPPSRIELEVTETAVMSEPARAVACIKELCALGLQIAVDDFGTGYSSMAYLKELLVAKIKIDKSFVKDMVASHNDDVIVRSTVELGHNLGLKVVAEGVENEVVWDRLKALGCDDGQGYYMSRPLPADTFAEWLEHSPWAVRRAADEAIGDTLGEKAPAGFGKKASSREASLG